MAARKSSTCMTLRESKIILNCIIVPSASIPNPVPTMAANSSCPVLVISSMQGELIRMSCSFLPCPTPPLEFHSASSWAPMEFSVCGSAGTPPVRLLVNMCGTEWVKRSRSFRKYFLLELVC